jgi:hypothetical protein
LWPGDAACCLLASLASRGRQAVSQPCRRTVSDHAWLVLDSSCQCDMTGGMHPVRNHTPLSSRNGVPDQATRSPSLRLREPTLQAHAIPCVREGREKLCKSMDDGCGAGTVGTMTSTLWGWMAPCSLQRRPNGAKIMILFMAPRGRNVVVFRLCVGTRVAGKAR